MCSYSDYKQSHPMAYGQPGSQFGQGGHNWFGQTYYSPHSYCHGAAMPQHHMPIANGPEPWSQHHHQGYTDWMHAIHQAPCQINGEYSTADDSDVTPSPASNRAISPSYNMPTRGRSPYEWMKKTSFQSEPSPGEVPLDYTTVNDYPYPFEWFRNPRVMSKIEKLKGGKTRTKDKYRVVYTDQQRVELEKEFLYNKYITIRRKTEMAASLGLSERQVKIWFQNRRAKQRKQEKKKQDLVQYKTADSMSVNSLMILN